eukprot:3389750-Rhodomonas_salina.2
MHSGSQVQAWAFPLLARALERARSHVPPRLRRDIAARNRNQKNVQGDVGCVAAHACAGPMAWHLLCGLVLLGSLFCTGWTARASVHR